MTCDHEAMDDISDRLELEPHPEGGHYRQTWVGEDRLTTDDGRSLALINPAYMVRQVGEQIAKRDGPVIRITSLTPVRPENAALETRDVPSLVPAGSTFASGFSQTAAGWKLQLLLSLIALLVTTGMLVYRPPSRASRASGDRQPLGTSP